MFDMILNHISLTNANKSMLTSIFLLLLHMLGREWFIKGTGSLGKTQTNFSLIQLVLNSTSVFWFQFDGMNCCRIEFHFSSGLLL